MPDPTWTPTRLEGLRRLDEFLPHAGRDYADRRNYDLGPDDRSNVSVLSPYLRHRLITEQEVFGAVLDRHGYRGGERFLQEVAWRTYWRGWLELRPGVWASYRDEVADLLGRVEADADLRERYDRAVGGRSGIACFDAWSRELVEDNYLHNHARMWFASIWIFTLKLPWALGADFFLRHLHCGCPASNTLSWRWVAGLQTKGKTYLATAENIARFTEGRFKPREPLSHDAPAIDGPNLPPIAPLGEPGRVGEGPTGLLLTEEDLAPETLGLTPGSIGGVAGVLATLDRSPRPTSEAVVAFASGAMEDALARASAHFEVPAAQLGQNWDDSVLSWARERSFAQIVTAECPVGPSRERLDALAPILEGAGIRPGPGPPPLGRHPLAAGDGGLFPVQRETCPRRWPGSGCSTRRWARIGAGVERRTSRGRTRLLQTFGSRSTE